MGTWIVSLLILVTLTACTKADPSVSLLNSLASTSAPVRIVDDLNNEFGSRVPSNKTIYGVQGDWNLISAMRYKAGNGSIDCSDMTSATNTTSDVNFDLTAYMNLRICVEPVYKPGITPGPNMIAKTWDRIPVPTAGFVNSTSPSGNYKAGTSHIIMVSFSQNVFVTGTPVLLLQLDSSTTPATYDSGSGSNTLNFRYTVTTGDNTVHLDTISVSPLSLPGGALIRDDLGQDAILTLPAPGSANSLGANRTLIIDTQAPAMTSISFSGTYYAATDYSALSTSSPTASWTTVTDGASYEVAVGSTPGGSEVSAWSNVGNTLNAMIPALGLLDNTNYYVSVRVLDLAGNISAPTSRVWRTDLTAPTTPSVLNAGLNPADLSIPPLLEWFPANDSGAGVMNYGLRIYRTSDNAIFEDTSIASGMTTFQSTLSTPLQPRTSFYFKVLARDFLGHESAFATGPSWIAPGWENIVTGSLTARYGHTAIWTGSKMIVWGGYDGAVYQDTGAIYDPVTRIWTSMSNAGAPTGRWNHTAIWTGSKMIVWGGAGTSSTYFNTGGIYDPATNTWTATSTVGDVPLPRKLHSAVWTGSRMIVWGGQTGVYYNTGGIYDPATDTWTATSTTGVPALRSSHSAVWTGSEMIVWGGTNGSAALSNGGRYDPSTDTWISVPTASLSGRYTHSATWTGSRMIVWGGQDYLGTATNTGASYDPGSGAWTSLPLTASTPTARYAHTAVWTGRELVIFGGTLTPPTNSGAKYDPNLNTWTSLISQDAPAARYNHTAVWTGTEMIIWGGIGAGYLSSGAHCTP